MEKDSKEILELFARYIIIILAGLGNLYIFYKILTPLTIKVLAILFSLFSNPVVFENFISLENILIEIVPACVAGSAFYLLFILVFSTAKINPKKRLKILGVSFLTLFILNILRIILLVLISNEPYFPTAHWVFWHLISTIFVVGIWIKLIYTYDLKGIPIYSDLKHLISLISPIKR